MKKQVLLFFASLFFSQAVFAYEYYDFSAFAPSGQTLFYAFSVTGVTVTCPGPGTWNGYTMPTGNLVIPDSVTYAGTTYRVTSIASYAFRHCIGLTSVTIPNSVTSIVGGAFSGCTGLTSVLFNADSCVAASGVFDGCSNITSFTFGSNVKIISDYLCSGMSGLTSVTIPASVKKIGARAFYNCTSMTSVNYTGTVDQWNNIDIGSQGSPIINSHNLYLNNVLLTDLVFSDTTTLIKNFAYDTALISVTIGNSVTRIEERAFSSCTGLTSVTIGNAVTSIGYHAFSGCTSLTSVTIPDSVTSIGDYAFSGCTGLTSVTIGNSVTSIAPFAFGGCTGLTSVTIPNSVSTLSGFSGCTGLTSVTIPNSVTTIWPFAFNGCTGLTSVTIGNFVTSIGQQAFSGCTGLTSVTIPDSVVSIGQQAFSGCTGLTSVTIPNSVTSIGMEAFSGCTGLASVTIGNSVTSIGEQSFYGCSGMTSMKFLGQIPPQQLGNNVFTGIPTDIPVYIPCGRLAYYAAQIPYFSNYVETMVDFSAMSDDESKGTVQVLTAPSCTDHNAVLYAVPSNGYRFDHWSTGSTDNPYTLTVTSDTTIIAYFVSNGGGTEGIGEIEEDDIRISVLDGRIVVEGITNEEVRVYDITGRMVQNRSLPSGVYIVKIGTLPAQKVVVMR